MIKHPVRKLIIGIILLPIALVIALVTAFMLMPNQFAQHFLSSKGSAKLDRSFSIDGPIKIDWDWRNPQIHISDIKLANTPNAKDPNMVAINQLDFHIRFWHLLEGQLDLPDISLDSPDIILEKQADGSANWEFPSLSSGNAAASAAMPSKRGNFPVIGNLIIKNGKLTYRDVAKKLDVTLAISTANAGGGAQGNFVLSGQGSLQNRPFTIDTQGGSLDLLRNSKEKYPLHIHIKMGATVVDVNGTFLDPVKMEGVDTKLEIRGDNLADLFYLTMIPLPPTPTYSLSGHLTKTGDVWKFENFAGKVGNSDVQGNLTDDISGKRSLIKAQLVSRMLDMKDLAGFTGATPEPRAGEHAAPEQKEKADQEKASPKLIPDVSLDLTRLRASDLDILLKAEKILAPGLPIDDLNIRFLLKEGVLRLDPLDFGVAAGHISGTLLLDGSKDVPRLETDLQITRLSLKQFFEHTQFEALTAGFIGGHFKIAGTGKSLAEVMGDSNGHVTFIMTGGKISQLIVAGAGLDVGGAAPLLIGDDKSASIRCAVLDFPVTDGVLDSKIFVIDTTVSTITGQVKVNLKNETIDGKVTADPKSPTVTLHAPITVSGALKHPSIGIDPKEAAERGAAAGVLSVFLTPLAAIIPFISTGVGEDSDCRDLIGQARAYVPAAAH